MILQRYTDFRAAFALPSVTLDPDGFEALPVAKLRTNGFSDLVPPVISTFPLTLSVYSAVVEHGFSFDWYVSQRTDDPALQVLTVAPLSPTLSHAVVLDLVPANVAKLLPGLSGADLLTPAALALLLKNIAVYVQRRSDKAYQWIALYPMPGT